MRKSLILGAVLITAVLVSSAFVFLFIRTGNVTPVGTASNARDELRTLGWRTLVNESRGGDPPPTVNWDSLYGGTGNDTGMSAVATGDGGFVLAGNTNSFGVTTQQGWLVRTDSNGNVVWNYTYGGTAGNVVEKVIAAGDGGFVAVGFTNSTGPIGYTPARGAGGYDAWLFKVSSTGSLEWERLFGGSANDYAYDVVKTADGGYILAGATASVDLGQLDMYLVKTDSDGNQQWTSTVSRVGDTVAYAVTPASGGVYVAAGYTNASGTDDLFVVKTDTVGHEATSFMLQEPGVDVAHGVVQAGDGGFYVEAVTNSFSSSYQMWLLKFNSTLSEAWGHVYGSSHDTFGYSLLKAADGGLLVAGSIRNSTSGPQDVFVMKTDSQGSQIWNMTFGGSGDDVAYSITGSGVDGYVIAATTNSFSSSNDAWLINLGSDFFFYPYLVSGNVNATVVVGNSVPHPPCGAANTGDTVGGMQVAEGMGVYRSGLGGQYYLDTDIAKYNSSIDLVYYSFPNVTNVIAVGGPGVDMLSYKYFFNPWYGPVYYQENFTSGVVYMITPTNTYNSSTWVSPGHDLALLESVYVPSEGRWVMEVGGFGGDGSRAAGLALQMANTGQLPFTLQGRAMLIQWIDSNGNAKVDTGDTFNVIEIVP